LGFTRQSDKSFETVRAKDRAVSERTENFLQNNDKSDHPELLALCFLPRREDFGQGSLSFQERVRVR